MPTSVSSVVTMRWITISPPAAKRDAPQRVRTGAPRATQATVLR
jgi:hypothetical protein